MIWVQETHYEYTFTLFSERVRLTAKIKLQSEYTLILIGINGAYSQVFKGTCKIEEAKKQAMIEIDKYLKDFKNLWKTFEKI